MLTSLAYVAGPVCPRCQCHVVITAAWPHGSKLLVCHCCCYVADTVLTMRTHVPMSPVLYRRRRSMGTWASVVSVVSSSLQPGSMARVAAVAWPHGPALSLLRGRYDADNADKRAYVPTSSPSCRRVGWRWCRGNEGTSTFKASKPKCERDGANGWR